MKKSLIFLSILAIAGTAAFVAIAEDDAVYSANTIGVIKYEIPAGGELTCISLPLDSMNDVGDWTFGNTPFADSLPKGSTVYFWNGTGWGGATKNAVTGKWPTDLLTKPIKQGEGFFVQLPSSSAKKEIAIVGELPVDGSVTNKITGGGNLNMTSVTFYPVDVVFGETELAATLDKGSTVYFWNGSGWGGVTKNAVTGKWPTDSLTKVIKMGQAVFVQGTQAKDVVIECPYDLD